MSWIKRRGQTTPSPNTVPQVPMYNSNHPTQEDQWQQQHQQPQNWYNHPQQQQQQFQPKAEPPPQNYWEQPSFPPQPFNKNAQQYVQYPPNQSGYYRNAGYQQQQAYANMQGNQQYNQNNMYQVPLQTQFEAKAEDDWNWGWGDEDNSNTQGVVPQANTNQDINVTKEEPAPEEKWNWSLDEANSYPTQPKPTPKPDEPTDNSIEQLFPKVSKVQQDLEVKHLVQDHLTVATGKRGKLETPQWSVESQMSQESSDDILHTSESDKSHMLSRSSTISHSPISGQEGLSLPASSSSHLGLVESKSEVSAFEEFEKFENKEIVKPDFTAPPPVNTQMPPQDDGGGNPFKRTGGLSHKSMNKMRPFQPSYHNQSVNLETLPDNSEQPDSLLGGAVVNTGKQVNQRPENNETPINDRNQYLETGQLSSPQLDFNHETSSKENEPLPPPGLRRMVLGQLEQPEQNHAINEPPPGLSRMVLGQTETTPSAVSLPPEEPPEGLRRMVPGESSSPESTLRHQREDVNVSEPELEQLSSLVPQPRSATIGADTPPVSSQVTNSGNRSKTIGGDVGSLGSSQDARKEAVKVQEQGKSDGGRRDSSEDIVKVSSPDSYKDKKYDRRRYRDRRHADDTDYYSDKEKDRREKERGREYDRKYSSLRKDKDRRRRDQRDYGRDSRNNEYYYRYEDGYENENRSRPSSRSDSMHDSYKERRHEREHKRHKERERERYRRHRGEPREAYNPYQEYPSYDPYNSYYQQYQYYEKLRRTNPRAYAEWYRKYYQQAAGTAASYGGEDRASVHSGRSSTNDDMAKDRYTRQSYYSQASLPQLGGYYGDTHAHSISGQYGLETSSLIQPFDHTDSSLNLEDTNVTVQRKTPAKFATAHFKASIHSGKLLRILPNYSVDGQGTSVEICDLQSLLVNDDEYKELSAFPGPLVKGVTHKKTIIEYCQNKIKGAVFNLDVVDPDSYVLMWELLILLLRQNGKVVGTDIAELLLKNREPIVRPSSVLSSISSADINATSEQLSENNSANMVFKEEEATNKFRDFLLYGSCQEALEWAMKHGLWGHALFLASKLDKRTYANVMIRFANGLNLNDPLQTLYQILSGKMPAAVSCVADEKWGDWRPHLAMILSNSSQRPESELNCKAITVLGDTLLNRGSLYAAQFCYLMAGAGFGKFDNPDSKLVLLGSNHKKPFSKFSTNEAIHMTEIYEYACSLNDPHFIIPDFQVYKYLLATRLADRGLLEKSLLYLEKLAAFIVSSPAAFTPELVDSVYNLADKLKFYDPVGDAEDESEFGGALETSRPDNSWLKDLRQIQNDYHAGLISQQSDNLISQPTNSTLDNGMGNNVPDGGYLSSADAWQHQQIPQANVLPQHSEYQQPVSLQENDYTNSQFSEPYWPQPNQQQWSEQTDPYHQDSLDQQQSYYGYSAQTEDAAPQISMPNSSTQIKSNQYDDEPLPDGQGKPSSPVKAKPQAAQDKTASTGWFGGIFSKLALKPKNQMKLPDDKNPKIVWDQDKKRWINVDEDNNESSNDIKPPPKMSDMMPKMQQPAAVPTFRPDGMAFNQPVQTNDIKRASQSNMDPPDLSTLKIGGPNMFKRPRDRNLKKSYVDVFNPSGKVNDAPKFMPSADGFGGQVAPQMNFFVPQPVNNSNISADFLTPAPHLSVDDQAQPQQ